MSYEANVLESLTQKFILHAAYVFNVYHGMDAHHQAEWRAHEIEREGSAWSRDPDWGATLKLAEWLDSNPGLAHKVEKELIDHHVLASHDYGPEMSTWHGQIHSESPAAIDKEILNNLTGNSIGAIIQGVCNMLYPGDHEMALHAAQPWVTATELVMLDGEAREAHEHMQGVVTGEAGYTEHPSIPGVSSYRDSAAPHDSNGRGEHQDSGMSVPGDAAGGGASHDLHLSTLGSHMDSGMSVPGDNSSAPGHDVGKGAPADTSGGISPDSGMSAPADAHHLSHHGAHSGHHAPHGAGMSVASDASGGFSHDSGKSTSADGHHLSHHGGHHSHHHHSHHPHHDGGMSVPGDSSSAPGHDSGMSTPADATPHHEGGSSLPPDAGAPGHDGGMNAPNHDGVGHHHGALDGSDLMHHGGG